MNKIIVEYKNWLTVNGISDSTIYNYSIRIENFMKYIKEEKIDKNNIYIFLLSL